VFKKAAPIQSPAKCEVRSVIRFLKAKVERPAEIHKQIVAGLRAQRFPLVSSPKETSRWEKFDDDDAVQEEATTWFKSWLQTSMTRGYKSWFQDLTNIWTMPATMLRNKVMYRQFIQSVGL